MVNFTLLILLVSLLWASVAKGSDLRWAPKPADRARVLADGLVASRDALANSLIVAYQPGGPLRPGSTGVTAFRSWMFLWKWCDLLSRTEKSEAAQHLAAHLRLSPEGKLAFFGPGYVPSPELKLLEVEELNRMPSEFAEQGFGEVLPADLASPTDQSIFEKLDPAIVAEWINDQDLSRLLFENLTDKDYVPGALLRLQEIHQVNAQKFREYRSLAVALALVYDQKFPSFWPHRQVDQKDVPMTNSSVGEQFKFWVQSNESRAL
ncbi:MAG TPA: hypothetical protein VIS99_09650, partial [Terrimicrobiaceae bacterium]